MSGAPHVCWWRQTEDGTYETGCGQSFDITSEPPHPWLRFCWCCGAPAVLVPYAEAVAPDDAREADAPSGVSGFDFPPERP